MASHNASPPPKGRQRLLIGGLLLAVVIGGVASFFLAGKKEVKEKEEFVIVDLSLPPPPPPPPPPKPPDEEAVKEPEEDSAEIAEADAPDEMSDEPTTDIDLGIDAGDLGAGTGGSFVVSLPRFGRGGKGGGGGGDGLLGNDMDSPPVPVSKIQPTYPNSLLSKGTGGKVLVTCMVDESGKVVSATVKQSAGHPDLDKAAIAAVTKWKFKPASKGGRNVRASCVVPFNFEVKKN
ncbi:energy transducer TonB [Luteolibacter sp. Populi]|uniref:energy transducer TonB n=1 Tax=Luteolibacter sp. Populi TaxID=3230487 RepID=UPI003467D66F